MTTIVIASLIMGALATVLGVSYLVSALVFRAWNPVDW